MYDEVLLGELHMPLKTLCFMFWEGSNVQVSISLLHLSKFVFVAIEVWTHLWYKQRGGGKKKPRKEEKKKNLPTGVNC